MLKIYRPQAPGPSLLRLSDSILLLIFQSLSRELYALSLLCRRLHHLALPVFLHQQGILCISDNITLHFTGSDIDALSALRIALFLPPTTRLTCHLTHLPKETQLFHMARLQKLVTKLSWIGKEDSEVHLHVTGMRYELENFLVRRERPEWMKTFSYFGDALIEKRCGRFVVRDENDERVFVLRQNLNPNRGNSKDGLWNAVMHSVNFRVRTPLGLQGIPENQQSQRVEMGFALHSLVIFPSLLRHLNFTDSSYGYSTLQSLSITALWVKEDEWSEILRTIALATNLTLSHLSIRAAYISPIDLFRLLSRAQRLTSLSISFTSLETTKQPVLRIHYPKLPYLTRISVPSSYASLFSKYSASASLRSLQSLDISLSSIHDLSSTAKTISTALRRFNQPTSSSVKSTLTIPFDSNTFKVDSDRDATFQFRSPLIVFKDRLKTDLDISLSWPGEGHPYTLPEGLILVDFFLMDHAVSINQRNDVLAFIFPRWLTTWFPDLKHLTFKFTHHSSLRYIIYSWHKIPILYIIHMKCPNIQTVTFGTECIDMASFGSIGIATALQSSCSSNRARTQFLDLPDDVLLLIFTYMSTMGIYAVSMLSQRLASLTIPVYLSRSTIPDNHGVWRTYIGRHELDDRKCFRNLSVFRRISQAHVPPRFRVKVVIIEGVRNVFMAFRYLQQLHLALDNPILSSLQEVQLNFCFLYTSYLADDMVRKKWSEMLSAFVHTVLRKTSATGVRIDGPEFSLLIDQSNRDVRIPDITQFAPCGPVWT